MLYTVNGNPFNVNPFNVHLGINPSLTQQIQPSPWHESIGSNHSSTILINRDQCSWVVNGGPAAKKMLHEVAVCTQCDATLHSTSNTTSNVSYNTIRCPVEILCHFYPCTSDKSSLFRSYPLNINQQDTPSPTTTDITAPKAFDI